MQVQYPESMNDPENQKAKMTLNGYYDREALTLKNGFKPQKGVAPDDRLNNAAKITPNTEA
jgi:hypothetical protein